MTLEDKLHELPAYVHCDDCGERHYLTFNKDIQGKWSIAYVEYESELGFHYGNGFETLEEAADFMLELLSITA